MNVEGRGGLRRTVDPYDNHGALQRRSCTGQVNNQTRQIRPQDAPGSFFREFEEMIDDRGLRDSVSAGEQLTRTFRVKFFLPKLLTYAINGVR